MAYIDRDIIERLIMKDGLYCDTDADKLYSVKRIRSLPIANVQEMTLENAIDYLHKVGWMQEHDRILTESAKVKHGKWVENMEVGGVFCSECGRETFDRHDEPITMGTAKGFALVLPYYCGFCGAKMDKEGSADA